MTAMIVPVALGERSYDILIGDALLDRAGELIARATKARRAVVVSDDAVAPLYLPRLQASLARAGIEAGEFVVPAGEGSKEFAAFGRLLDGILAQRPDRGVILIALGGGVVGDLTGFAAAVLLRGLDFVQIPTTLLAQVDSSVGGKTGVNSPYGKNLIGAFHQPRLVLADIELLDSLSARELRAGYAEVVKYGLIDDAGFFAWLERNGAALLAGDRALRAEAVAVSCRAKARIVAQDEREGGVRALLNLGHTFGHALEAETGYGSALLHGEAVAIGMAMAFEMSLAMGLCPAEDLARLRRHYAATDLPGDARRIGQRRFDSATLIEHMMHDKKTRDGKLTFILARGIGQSFIAKDVPVDTVRGALDRALEQITV
ncbi:MAG: 3-dehydroquinate synthase [Reyranellaceae bacterium]